MASKARKHLMGRVSRKVAMPRGEKMVPEFLVPPRLTFRRDKRRRGVPEVVPGILGQLGQVADHSRRAAGAGAQKEGQQDTEEKFCISGSCGFQGLSLSGVRLPNFNGIRR